MRASFGRHRKDCIAGLDRVEHIERFAAELPGDRVIAVEVRLRRVAEEELAAAGVGAARRYPHGSTDEMKRAVLVGQRPAGTAVAVAARVSSLDDEVGHHSMERQTVVEMSRRERSD